MGKWYDYFRIISLLTPARIANLFLVFCSYYLSRITGKPRVWGMPLSVAVEPTTACNLRCPECPSGLRSFTRDTGNLKSATFYKALDELSKTAVYLNLYFQGEPFIHPGFLDLVKGAKKYKLYTATSTNAHFIDDETARQTVMSGLDRLIISLDGLTQETYSKYRVQGNLEKVIHATEALVSWKKKLNSPTPYLIFQFLLTSHNQHEVEEAKAFAKKTGVNEIRFKTAQVYDFEMGNSLIPENEDFSRYTKNSDGTYSVKNPMLNHCWRMWQSPVITWDGWVVPCCFDKDAQHKMGNMRGQSFREVWHSRPYTDFRKKVMSSRSETDICKNCSEGTNVFA